MRRRDLTRCMVPSAPLANIQPGRERKKMNNAGATNVSFIPQYKGNKGKWKYL
jgi:hypothetical protein